MLCSGRAKAKAKANFNQLGSLKVVNFMRPEKAKMKGASQGDHSMETLVHPQKTHFRKLISGRTSFK